jgi:hypothetical protein
MGAKHHLRGRKVTRTHFLANCIAVPGPCLPPRCRADSLFPGVATDHQFHQRAEQVVTRNPTGNPLEQR